MYIVHVGLCRGKRNMKKTLFRLAESLSAHSTKRSRRWGGARPCRQRQTRSSAILCSVRCSEGGYIYNVGLHLSISDIECISQQMIIHEFFLLFGGLVYSVNKRGPGFLHILSQQILLDFVNRSLICEKSHSGRGLNSYRSSVKTIILVEGL